MHPRGLSLPSHEGIKGFFLLRLPEPISPRCLLKLQSVPPSFVVIVPTGLIADRGD